MKKWENPKLSNLNVSQTMNTPLNNSRALSWQCECPGCNFTTVYYPDSIAGPTIEEQIESHMSQKHPYGCSIS